MFPLSKITPGGGVIVQGENFAAGDGSFGQFELILCSISPCTSKFQTTLKLENVQWGDTFVAGTIPTYWGPQADISGNLFVARSDGAISNPIPVGFIATRDFAVLPSTDVQSDCSQGADWTHCDEGGRSGTSAAVVHTTSYGHDMGTDQFTATLQNGWVFYNMDFANEILNRDGNAQPPAGFDPLSNSLQLRVYWEENGGGWPGDGAFTTYYINLYIMGPKGVKWK
ncbi:MAG: hypothetical protein M3Z54_10785 [Gemmatimonadota bacterium]|nr:hypothetical protein [Gemmatimonadota bacterium]